MMATVSHKTIISAYVLTLILSLLMPSSCIRYSDDEIPEPPSSVSSDTTQIDVDSVYLVSVEYMYGEWRSQYVGFDLRQMKASAIRRLVFFSEDGFYDSHVQGILSVNDSITTYKEFEHEHGAYFFDDAKHTMKYSLEYDSLLNFATDKLEYFPGKILPGIGQVKDYEELIWFSKEKDGKRDWIRIDENLVTEDNHTARVIYVMRNRNEE